MRRGKVFVNCEFGSSRSPVVVALYLHVIGYKDFQNALAELHELRPLSGSVRLDARTCPNIPGDDMKRAAINAALVRDRLSGTGSTETATRYRVSRPTVVRLAKKSRET